MKLHKKWLDLAREKRASRKQWESDHPDLAAIGDKLAALSGGKRKETTLEQEAHGLMRRHCIEYGGICGDCGAETDPTKALLFRNGYVTDGFFGGYGYAIDNYEICPDCLEKRRQSEWSVDRPRLVELPRQYKYSRLDICAHCEKPMEVWEAGDLGLKSAYWRDGVFCCTKHRDRYYVNQSRSKVEHSEQPCAYCGESFLPKRSTAKYCSTKCRVAAHRKGGDPP